MTDAMTPSRSAADPARARHRRVRPLVGVVAGLVLVCAYALVAAAFWTTSVTGDANAAVTTLNGPTGVNASAVGSTVTVGFVGATAPAGQSLAGYYVTRHAGPTTSAACGTVAGTPGTYLSAAATTCTDSSVANGTYTYRVTAVFRSWTAPSAPSANVVVSADTTAPTQSLAVTAVSGGTHRAGSTLYYGSGAAGSFTLTSTLTDSGSGPASVSFPAVSASGWTHATETVAPGTGTNPTKTFTSSSYAWEPGAASPGNHTVTGADVAGNTVTSSLDLVADGTGPTGGSLTINTVAAAPGGAYNYDNNGGWSGTRTNFSGDSGSGLASSVLTREYASGACASYGPATVVTGNPSEPNNRATGCYRYTLTGTDNVGNTSALVIVITTFNDNLDPTQTFSATGNGYVNGGTLYYRNSVAGSFTLTSTITDNASGPAQARFANVTTAGWTHPQDMVTNGVGSHPTIAYSSVYSFNAGAAVPAAGQRTIRAYDIDGNDVDNVLPFTIDNSAPTGGSLNVNGSGANGGGTTSNSGTGTFTGTRNHYTADVGSGVDSSVLTREVASWNGSTCGTYGSATVLTGAPSETNASTGCYRYTLTGTDRVGNSVSVSTVVRVTNGTFTQAVTMAGAAGTAVQVGSTIYYDADAAGSFTLNAMVTDTASGPLRAEFPAVTAAGWSHDFESVTNGTGLGSTRTYSSGTFTWAANASSPGAYTVTGYNVSGGSVATALNLVQDVTGPTGGAITVNGTAGTSAGATGYSSSGTFTGTVTPFSADAGVGYQSTTLTRAYSSSLTDGTCGTYGAPSPVTLISETGAASGCYLYTLTGFDVFGNTSVLSVEVKVDKSAPTVALTSVGGNGYLTGGTVYFRGNAAGSLTLTATVTDAQSGPASVRFPDDGSTNWVHANETVTDGSGSAPTIAYTSSSYTWTAGAPNLTNAAARTLTGADRAGNLATTLAPTFISDVTAPTGAALTVNGTAASSGGSTSNSTMASWAIGRTDYSADTGSGFATSVLTRESATWNGTACGAFSGSTTINGSANETEMAGATCYRYTLTGTDNVGNQASLSTIVRTSVVTVTSVTLNNGAGGTSGTLNRGDTIVVQFSEAMAVDSLCSTWSGNTTNQSITANNVVGVTIRNGGGANDYMEVTTTGAACGGGFNFGSLTLGDTGYLTATQVQTFRGSGGSNASTIAYNTTTLTLTITLGYNETQPGVDGSNNVPGNTVATFTPSAALRNAGGLNLTGNRATANVRQF